MSVGTKTFRHSVGSNNFVQRDLPLGSSFGSDGFQLNTGFYYLNFDHLVWDLNFGVREYGEESLKYRPDYPYDYRTSKEFPSGQINKLIFIKNSVDYIYNKNLFFNINLEYSKINENKSNISILTGIHILIN